MTNNTLPENVIAALQNGETIEAIKRLREASGLGLKEAKDVIDAYSHGVPVNVVSSRAPDTLPADVVAAIRQGNKIEAIKLLREQTGLGLKEAKDAVESSPQSAASNGRRPSVEIPGTGNVFLLLAGLVLAGFAAYYLYSQLGR